MRCVTECFCKQVSRAGRPLELRPCVSAYVSDIRMMVTIDAAGGSHRSDLDLPTAMICVTRETLKLVAETDERDTRYESILGVVDLATAMRIVADVVAMTIDASLIRHRLPWPMAVGTLRRDWCVSL